MTNSVSHIPGSVPARGASSRSVLDRVASQIRAIRDRIVRAAKIRETYDMLNELDDRTLHDIGISRGEIKSVAVHSADYPDIPYHHHHRKRMR